MGVDLGWIRGDTGWRDGAAMIGSGLIAFAVGWIVGVLRDKDIEPEHAALHFLMCAVIVAIGIVAMLIEQEAVCLGLRSV